MSSKLKVGLVGCGKQAPKHIQAYRALPDVEVVLGDIAPEYAQQMAAQEAVAAAESLDALFADPSVQIIDICTPTPSHEPLIRRAIEVGKDVFCEKPLCQSLTEAQALQALAAAKGRLVVVGYIYRFCPVFAQGHQFIHRAEPVLNNLSYGMLRIGGRGDHQVWKHKRDNGGGAINEMLVHMLDLALWYFGPLSNWQVLSVDQRRAERTINGVVHEVDAEDLVMVQAETGDGAPVFIQADLLTPAFSQGIELQFANGSFAASIQGDRPSYLFLKDAVGGYPAGKTTLTTESCDLYHAQMSHLLAAVESRDIKVNSIDDSVALMQALETIHQQISLP